MKIYRKVLFSLKLFTIFVAPEGGKTVKKNINEPGKPYITLRLLVHELYKII